MSKGSNLVTRAGLIVLAVLVLLSAYFHYSLLNGLLLILLILCALSYFWTKFSVKKIRVMLTEQDFCAFPGEHLRIHVSACNEKILPVLWMDLLLETKENCCIASEESQDGKGITESFAWVMPYQTISWETGLLAVHRGVFRLERFAVSSGDGFGLASAQSEIAVSGACRIVVYPKIHSVNPTPVLSYMNELERAKDGFYTDRTLLRSTRDYHDGDNARNINWRLLARTDHVQLNVYESQSFRRVCFLPDLKSFTLEKEEFIEGKTTIVSVPDRSSLERMISLIASLVVSLTQRDVLCTLVIPSFGRQNRVSIIPETTDTQIEQILTALAELDYNGETVYADYANLQEEKHLLGRIYRFRGCSGSDLIPEDDSLLGVVNVETFLSDESCSGRDVIFEKELLTVL